MAKSTSSRSRRENQLSTGIPASMKAAAVGRFGPASLLRVHELPIPEPGPNEILIRLDAAGVGVWDASIRDGSWRAPGRPRFPLVPGVDGAGVVVAKGSRVRRFGLGDRVYAYEFGERHGGFYAEYVAVQAVHAGQVPKSWTLETAAAGAATGLTALQGIDALQVRQGQRVLIFGASGAVGTLAVQFAAQTGAHVIGTASGDAAQRLVRRLGAADVFDARRPDAVDRLRESSGKGFDGVLALAGGPDLERCLDFVRLGGHVVYPNGVEPIPGDREVFRVDSYDGIAGTQEFAALNRRINRSRIRVPIAAVYPLGRAAQAHRRLDKGRILGRLVLRIRARR
jgi:NADPH:quinone reductase